MSFVPDNDLGYLDTIQVFFVELTQRSIMFSGRDLKLLEEWRERGATARDVCRGLQDAATAMPSDDPPRNIWSCRKWVEPHVERARSRGAGGHPDAGNDETAEDPEDSTSDGLVEEALGRIERAGRRAEDEAVRQVYRRVWRRVRGLVESDDTAPFEELASIEEDLVEAYFETLDDARRAEIERRIKQEAGAHLDRMTEKARGEHMTAQKRRILIDEEGMAPLLE
jgi:hypothetical protein